MYEAYETTKKEEKYLTGLRQRISQFTFFKKFTVPKAQHQSGRPNGDMKPYLAVARAQKAELQFSLRTILVLHHHFKLLVKV